MASVDIDVVSGATVDTKAFQTAVENAPAQGVE
ncbi:MAG: FMN-binding protein [Chitinivibrionales bacterium]|nr:FMN-binding protein [Chitinivibrionales bacterium]